VASDLAWAVFGVSLVAGLANTVGILASAVGHSDYYPPGGRDWTYYALWGLSHAVNGAILVLTYLQFGTLAIPPAVSAGAFLFVVLGFAIATAAGFDLGVDRTTGLEGALRTDGWYRYSRNPQYVGYVLATIAFPLWSGAPLSLPLLGIYLVWWLAFPHAEERWLCEQHGEAYEAYAERVPRFVGRHTLRKLLGRNEGVIAGEST
jgi:protein-S-isoprenylcysteine O-methyltransferase Ste14